MDGTVPGQKSSTGSLLNLSGNAQVFIAAVAEDLVPFDSPAFTGFPTAPTQTAGDSSTKLATTGFVTNALGNSQPLDADLTALAALTGVNTIYYRSAANTWSPVTYSGGITFTGGVLSAAAGGDVFLANNNVMTGSNRFTQAATTPITIGHTAPVYGSSVTKLEIHSGSLISSAWSNDVNANSILLTKSRGTTPGVFTATAPGDRLGTLSFQGAITGGTVNTGVMIYSEAEGAPVSGAVPASLSFLTVDGAGAATVRWKLHASGGLAKAGVADPGIGVITATSFIASETVGDGTYGLKVQHGAVTGLIWADGATNRVYLNNNTTGAIYVKGRHNAEVVPSTYIGELTTANANSGPLTNGSHVAFASVGVPAGEWEFTGRVHFTLSGRSGITQTYASLSTVAAADPGTGLYSLSTASDGLYSTLVKETFKFSTTTTVYLNLYGGWSGPGTVSGNVNLIARRIG
jgi:hypothetical protein